MGTCVALPEKTPQAPFPELSPMGDSCHLTSAPLCSVTQAVTDPFTASSPKVRQTTGTHLSKDKPVSSLLWERAGDASLVWF